MYWEHFRKDSFRDQEVSFFLFLLLYHFTVIDFATSRFYFTTTFAFHTFVAREEERLIALHLLAK